MPSPVADQPGLLLRDPFRYTDNVLIIPPPWLALLQCLDGEHTVLDGQAILTRLNGGEIVPRDKVQDFVGLLSEAGYVEGEELNALKERRHAEFRSSPVREAVHAGAAYPDERDAIEALFSERLIGTANPDERRPLAVAAPHVSPEGGLASYAAAYRLLPMDEDTTFVILGTSHYGAPERFGTTKKPFATPLGTVEVDTDVLTDFQSHAGDAVLDEDYCHRSEHSIELQVVFLQYHLSRPFRIVPILCGPFLESLESGKPPESRESNRRAFAALAELHAKHENLVWILGVDMAHIGTRYGHREPARAGQGRMVDVAAKDERRLERLCAGDAEGFFELTHPGGDELNWCGYSPLYTFLRSVGAAEKLRGEVRSYEQWNIDPSSVVTFGAVHFFGT